LRLAFLGTPDFAVPSLLRLHEAGHSILFALCRPDRPAGRGRRVQACPVKQRAQALGISVLQPERIDQGVITQVSHAGAELAVVVAYGLILPSAFLALPRRGCVNVHASLLPRWRGASPIVHAILQGDRTIGVTTIRMDEGIDTGPILLQRESPLGEAETTGEAESRLSHLGADLLLETLDRMEQGVLQPKPQDSREASYAPKIRPELARIAWDARALTIIRQVNAFNPRPGAGTSYRGTSLKIWGAALCATSSVSAPSGTILPGQGLRVACGRGSCIELLEVQMEGRRRISGAEALRGRWFEPGGCFGKLSDSVSHQS